MIYSEKKIGLDKQINKHHKINSFHTNITSICQALQQLTEDYDQNQVSFTIIKHEPD